MKNILLSLTMALTALGGVTNAAQAETLVLYDFTGTPRNSPAALPSVTTPPPAGVVPSNFTRGPGLGNTTTVTTGFLDANHLREHHHIPRNRAQLSRETITLLFQLLPLQVRCSLLIR
jgi:hypothetical protein